MLTYIAEQSIPSDLVAIAFPFGGLSGAGPDTLGLRHADHATELAGR